MHTNTHVHARAHTDAFGGVRVGLVNSADLVRLDRSQHTGSAPSVGAYLRRSLGFTRDRSQVPLYWALVEPYQSFDRAVN